MNYGLIELRTLGSGLKYLILKEEVRLMVVVTAYFMFTR